MKTPHKLETHTPRCVWEKLFLLCSFLNQQKTTLLQSCALVAVTIPVIHSLTKKELKTTLQTWEEDQTTFHQFLPLLTQKTQQYPEQESVDQAFHSPHPGPGQDPQFLHNKNNEKNLITAMLNDATYRSFKSTDYSSSHYVTFFSSLICVMVI